MKKFDVFAGLNGGFGGAEFIETIEADNEFEAEEYAYQYAVDMYQSYEGYYGILSWEDCYNALKEYGPDTFDDNMVDDYYLNEIESWIVYYVIEVE